MTSDEPWQRRQQRESYLGSLSEEGLKLESEARALRNAVREQRRARKEYLAGLSEEERTAVLTAEREAEEAAQRLAAQDARSSDTAMSHARHAAAAAYKRDRQILVVALWQSLRGHTLSAERREEFLARPEVEELASFPGEALEVTGRRAMAEHHGELHLTHWLEEARARDRKEQARSEIPWWARNVPAR